MSGTKRGDHMDIRKIFRMSSVKTVLKNISFIPLLLIILLSSCDRNPKIVSAQSSNSASGSFSATIVENDMSYFSSRKIDININIEGGYSLPVSFTATPDAVAVLFRFIPSDGLTPPKNYLGTYGLSGELTQLAELSGLLDGKILSQIRSDSQGNILIFESGIIENQVYCYSLLQNQVLNTVTLEMPSGYVATDKFFFDSVGQFYLIADGTDGRKIFVFDSAGKLITAEYRDGLTEVAFESCGFFFFEGTSVENGKRVFYPFNIGDLKFSETVDASNIFGNEIIFEQANYLCSINSSGLALLDLLSREKWNQIVWDESGIDKRLLNMRPEIVMLDETRLFMMIENEDQSKEMYLLSQESDNPNAGKKTIVLASVSCDEDLVLQDAINDFNTTNSEFRVVHVDYYPYSDIDWVTTSIDEVTSQRAEAYEALYLDMLSGYGPDLIYEPSHEILVSGAIVDLMSLIESDNEFILEEYSTNLIEAMKTDDALYSFPVFFRLSGLGGKTSVIGEREGWTIEEFNEVMSELPGDVTPITLFSQSELLEFALGVSASGYVVTDASGDRLSMEDMVLLLEWAKENGIPDDFAQANRESGEAYYLSEQLIINDKLALIQCDVLSPYYLYDAAWFSKGAPMTYVGPPTPNRVGFAAEVSDIVMTKSCSSPEGAWTFISYFVSDHVQSEVIKQGTGIPVLRESIDLLVDLTLNPEAYPELIIPIDGEVVIDPIADAAYKDYLKNTGIPLFYDLVYGVDTIIVSDNELISIVLEEAPAYFYELKSAEDVAEIIANRVQILINERAS